MDDRANHESHLEIHKFYATSLLEHKINLNPPRWYDRFIFWKKRKPEWKNMIEIQMELNRHLADHLEKVSSGR